ncbi:hypothetical protein DSO57_1039672 [Entomophthora muscae]|uniref:Uncharacterized protein n=1 Tax=Entomophthora muscae TaxID=34485 RepID=A0ACC2RRX2_9FUNG|nr:hypothetical protein DSO57_1039672 [Entomophthora muscae]
MDYLYYLKDWTGSKWAFICFQKEDSLRNLLVYSPGVWETIDICQYLESSNNLLDLLNLVLGSCALVLDSCSLVLDSCSLLGLLLLYLGLLHLYLDLQLSV